MIRSLHTIITANYVLFTGGILRNNFCNSVQRPINNSRQLFRNWQSLMVGRNSRALQGCTSHSAESLNSIFAARRIRSPRDTAIPRPRPPSHRSFRGEEPSRLALCRRPVHLETLAEALSRAIESRGPRFTT